MTIHCRQIVFITSVYWSPGACVWQLPWEAWRGRKVSDLFTFYVKSWQKLWSGGQDFWRFLIYGHYRDKPFIKIRMCRSDPVTVHWPGKQKHDISQYRAPVWVGHTIGNDRYRNYSESLSTFSFYSKVVYFCFRSMQWIIVIRATLPLMFIEEAQKGVSHTHLHHHHHCWMIIIIIIMKIVIAQTKW